MRYWSKYKTNSKKRNEYYHSCGHVGPCEEHGNNVPCRCLGCWPLLPSTCPWRRDVGALLPYWYHMTPTPLVNEKFLWPRLKMYIIRRQIHLVIKPSSLLPSSLEKFYQHLHFLLPLMRCLPKRICDISLRCSTGLVYLLSLNGWLSTSTLIFLSKK